MSIFPSWNGQITPPTVRIRAIAVITAFPLEERSPSMRCGPTRTHIPLLRRSKVMSRSIPSESTRSRSDEKIIMSETIQEKNKALVLEAFDTLFNKRDYAAAEKYWSPNYIQHSAHIEPG